MANVKLPLPDIAPGRSAIVEVEGQRLVVCRSQKGVYVVRDNCPHQNLTLEGGRVRGESIICPHHGARFSLEDGRSMSPLTTKPLALLPCRAEGDSLEIEL